MSGPTFTNVPGYPALRVVDFQVVGERVDNGPGFFNVRRYATARLGYSYSITEIMGCLTYI